MKRFRKSAMRGVLALICCAAAFPAHSQQAIYPPAADRFAADFALMRAPATPWAQRQLLSESLGAAPGGNVLPLLYTVLLNIDAITRTTGIDPYTTASRGGFEQQADAAAWHVWDLQLNHRDDATTATTLYGLLRISLPDQSAATSASSLALKYGPLTPRGSRVSLLLDALSRHWLEAATPTVTALLTDPTVDRSLRFDAVRCLAIGRGTAAIADILDSCKNESTDVAADDVTELMVSSGNRPVDSNKAGQTDGRVVAAAFKLLSRIVFDEGPQSARAVSFAHEIESYLQIRFDPTAYRDLTPLEYYNRSAENALHWAAEHPSVAKP